MKIRKIVLNYGGTFNAKFHEVFRGWMKGGTPKRFLSPIEEPGRLFYVDFYCFPLLYQIIKN